MRCDIRCSRCGQMASMAIHLELTLKNYPEGVTNIGDGKADLCPKCYDSLVHDWWIMYKPETAPLKLEVK